MPVQDHAYPADLSPGHGVPMPQVDIVAGHHGAQADMGYLYSAYTPYESAEYGDTGSYMCDPGCDGAWDQAGGQGYNGSPMHDASAWGAPPAPSSPSMPAILSTSPQPRGRRIQAAPPPQAYPLPPRQTQPPMGAQPGATRSMGPQGAPPGCWHPAPNMNVRPPPAAWLAPSEATVPASIAPVIAVSASSPAREELPQPAEEEKPPQVRRAITNNSNRLEVPRLVVRNTFVDVPMVRSPSEERLAFLAERQVKSCPVSAPSSAAGSANIAGPGAYPCVTKGLLQSLHKLTSHSLPQGLAALSQCDPELLAAAGDTASCPAAAREPRNLAAVAAVAAAASRLSERACSGANDSASGVESLRSSLPNGQSSAGSTRDSCASQSGRPLQVSSCGSATSPPISEAPTSGTSGGVAEEAGGSPGADGAAGGAGALEEAALGTSELPSRGSTLHRWGACKPCAFFYQGGCKSGVECQFCHLCEPGEKKRRKKERQQIKREARERDVATRQQLPHEAWVSP